MTEGNRGTLFTRGIRPSKEEYLRNDSRWKRHKRVKSLISSKHLIFAFTTAFVFNVSVYDKADSTPRIDFMKIL